MDFPCFRQPLLATSCTYRDDRRRVFPRFALRAAVRGLVLDFFPKMATALFAFRTVGFFVLATFFAGFLAFNAGFLPGDFLAAFPEHFLKAGASLAAKAGAGFRALAAV